jgi:hypothetical protein
MYIAGLGVRRRQSTQVGIPRVRITASIMIPRTGRITLRGKVTMMQAQIQQLHLFT